MIFFHVEKFIFCAARRATWRAYGAPGGATISAIFFAPPGAPGGAKTEIFEVLEIMKKQKNSFNKRFTWKSDQEEF